MESMYSVAGYISVPDPDLEISKGGGGVGGGRSSRPFWSQFGLKIRGGSGRPPRAPPLDPPLYFKVTVF